MTRRDRWCPECGASIAFLAPQARYCSGKCKKAASRLRKRDALGHRPVSLAGEAGYFDAVDATRGYLDDWQLERKTQIMLGQVKQILEEYSEQLPLTCRQTYYRMIAAYQYPKGESFESSLYGMLDNARRAREIPFEHIRDDGIMGGGWWPTSPQQRIDGWKLEAENYQRDVQQDQPVRIQVWCESAGMVPQLARVADPYSVPVYSCGGFNSLTSVRQIVDSCRCDTRGPTVLLHLGDCDPSGFSIFQAVYEDVATFLEEDRFYPEQTFSAERVAITFDQIEQYGLTADEIKTKDSRSLVWRERGLMHKTEIEALAPDVIADLLKQAIERHVDLDLIEEIRAAEKPERDALRDVAEMSQQVNNVFLAGDRLGQRIASWGRS